METLELEVQRFKCLTQLVTDPAIEPYKRADPERASSAARQVLARRCRDISGDIWRDIEQRYGVRRDKPFCVAYAASSPVCLLALTSDARKALHAAAAWLSMQAANGFAGRTDIEIAVVAGPTATVFSLDCRAVLRNRRTLEASPEHFVQMAAALAYRPPPASA